MPPWSRHLQSVTIDCSKDLRFLQAHKPRLKLLVSIYSKLVHITFPDLNLLVSARTESLSGNCMLNHFHFVENILNHLLVATLETCCVSDQPRGKLGTRAYEDSGLPRN
jgi:hypothetical protein